jgi:hypothetical protein
MRQSIIGIVLVAALGFSGTACSIYKAASQPGPANLTGMSVGTPRAQLIAQLGAPKFSDMDSQNRKQDVFEFDSGMNQAAKARIIPYLAADLFTLGLAELILWPAELTVMERAKCLATVTYDTAEKVDTWNVTKKDGVQDC